MTDRTYRRLEGKWQNQTKTGAYLARSNDGLCGPEALLFEPIGRGERIRRIVRKDPFITYMCVIGVLGAGVLALENFLS